METNEAPEKIYITNYNIPSLPKEEQLSERWHEVRTQDTDIEYTRTDAFVEKASELLVNCIEDFMARRMEIWGEECKKQTLENLRNALKE